MLHQFIKSLIAVGIVFVGASCAPREIVDKPIRLEKKKEKELIAALDSIHSIRPLSLFTKIKSSYSDTSKSVTFKTTIRLMKDSFADVIITKMNLPVASALITTDSISIANKLQKCIIQKDLSYFKAIFQVDFNYQNLEELLLGLPLGFDTTQKYFQINDPFKYIISSVKKKELRRESRNNRNERIRNNRRNEDNNFVFVYQLAPDLKSIKHMSLNSPSDTTSIEIDYLSRDSVDTYLLPNEVSVVIKTPRNRIVIDLDYGSTSVNEPQEILFTIPEGYETCGIKED
jgi:hypothetical protein